MRRIIVAVCVAISAIAGASASAQAPVPAGQQPGATAVELKVLRSELERARERLEAWTRDIASRREAETNAVTSELVGGPAAGRMANQLGTALVDAEGGALVTAVMPGSGAANAGIKVGDLIQAIDGLDLSAESSPSATLLDGLAEIAPGESVTLAVERAGNVLEHDVEVEGWPRSATAQAVRDRVVVLDDIHGIHRIGDGSSEGSGQSGGRVVVLDNPGFGGIQVISPTRLRPLDLAASAWGEMELVPLTSGLGRYFGTDEGLLVVRGPSDGSIGIEDGDVILAIGGRTPSSPEHAIRILASFEPGETIEFSIMRDKVRETVEYAVP